MFSAGSMFVLSVSVFSVYALFTALEKRSGKRFILTKFRDFLDRVIVRITAFFARWLNYLGRYIIQLSWYYSIHRFLMVILTALVKAYDKLELVFINNKARARVLKIEKRSLNSGDHLQQVADHKISTTLTDKQKKHLRAKKLERE